jgi:murein biosynthesis integral membrane protein MurJ
MTRERGLAMTERRYMAYDLQPGNNAANKIIRATCIVMGITIAVKVLGFLEKLILAYFFGTSMEVDAYLIAYSIPFMIFTLVREVIEPAFLPTFMESMKDRDELTGWRLLSIVFNISLILLVVITVIGIVGAPLLISVLAPGFEGSEKVLTIQMTRIIMPASLFLGLSALTYITLNSYKRFTVPALGDIAFKGLAIGLFILSVKILGIFALIVGVVLGALARLLVHIIGLWKKRKLYRYIFDFKYEPMKKTMRLMLPLFIGIVFSQLSLMVDNMFASTLETGSISALVYSKKLVEMPVIVLPYALGVVIFPFFSELAISNEKEKLVEILMHVFKLIGLIFIPLAIGFIVLRKSIVGLLFERGAFDIHSTQLTSSALLYYSMGLVSFAIEAILVQFYFSMSDTKTPIAVGIGCVLLNILFTFILIKPLAHRGIALALTMSKTLKVAILYGLLKKKLVDIQLTRLFTFSLKVGFAAFLMGLSVSFISKQLAYLHSTGIIGQTVSLFALTFLGIFVFITTLSLMKVEEMKLYWKHLKLSVMRIRKSKTNI